MKKTSEEIGRELAEKTFRELGIYGNRGESKGKSPARLAARQVNSPKLPFQIPAIEKTMRQAQSTQGYKASAAWQAASLLRDLVELYLEIIPARQFRRKTQLEDAARSPEVWFRLSRKVGQDRQQENILIILAFLKRALQRFVEM